MRNFTDALFEDFDYEKPYYKDIINNNVNWLVAKFLSTKIGNKYGRSWYSQMQYMTNAYIGETNNLGQLSDPAIVAYINDQIDKYCQEHPEQLHLRLDRAGSYRFNPYPNDHEKLDDIDDIDRKKNVTDIIHVNESLPAGIIYDIDSKNTAEGGQGTDKMHSADAIMYNNQDTGEVTFYLAKYGRRDLRHGLESYVKICTISGPINYIRVAFIDGFPKVIDFANKNFETPNLIIPKLSIQAMDYLKGIAEKNSDYVGQHLDKYGQKGQDLIIAYDNFRSNAVDILTIYYEEVAKNINNKKMYNLKVTFMDSEGQLDFIIFKNANDFDLVKLRNCN